MKTRLFLIAAVAVATLTSCKEKNLPWVSLEEDNYCAEAKALLPSKGLVDSISYLAGIQNGIPAVYDFRGLDIERCNKAIKDFKSVDRKAFNKAAQTNFAEEYADADKFEINPALLSEIAQKVTSLPQEEEVSASLRDSMSYIYGVLCGFRLSDLNLNFDRAAKGMQDFVTIDTDSLYMKYAAGHFADSSYVDYAARFEMDPQSFNNLYQQFNQAKQQAMMKNYEEQSKIFVKKAAKVKDFETKNVSYAVPGTADSTATAQIIYRFDKKGNGAKVAYEDNFKVTYKGMHIDESVFDEGEFPVNNFSDQGLIKGFIETLLLMHEGDKVTVVIPGELGYGKQGSYQWWSGTYTIYPNEALVFELSVSDLLKPTQDAPEAEEAPAEEEPEVTVIDLDEE